MNEYSNPAQAQFINTYVPIPFEQLYNLGLQAKQDVEKAVEKVGSTVSKWSEFESPSQADTKAWYDATVGKVKPLINEMSNNMDLMKSAEGRARMNSLINNVDVASLSAIKQSAENMKQRQKLDQEMMVRGMYNPAWHKVDYTNYNTRQQGTFNDMSPIAYKDIPSIAEPYFKDVTKRYLGTKNNREYYGVAKEDVEKAAQMSFNDIYNTPEAQMHMKVMMQNNPSLTPDKAKEQLYKEVVQSQMSKAKVTDINPDQVGLELMREKAANFRAALAASKKGEGSDVNGAVSNKDLYTKIQQSGIQREGLVHENESGWINNKLKIEKATAILSAAKAKGDIATANAANQVIEKSQRDIEQLQRKHIRQTFNLFSKDNKGNDYASKGYAVGQGTKAVINEFTHRGSAVAGEKVIEALGGVRKSNNDNKFLMNTSNLIPTFDFVLQQMSSKGVNKDAFSKVLRSGNIRDVTVEPTNELVTYGGRSYVKVRANIPDYELTRLGIPPSKWDKTIRDVYGADKSFTSETKMDITEKYDEQGTKVTTTRRTSNAPGGAGNYNIYSMDMLLPVEPGLQQEAAGSYYNKEVMGTSEASKRFSGVEAAASMNL